MINALEKVVYPNGKTQSLAEIGGAVEGLSALIDEVDKNTSAISSITSQLSALVEDVNTNTSAITSINTQLSGLVSKDITTIGVHPGSKIFEGPVLTFLTMVAVTSDWYWSDTTPGTQYAPLKQSEKSLSDIFSGDFSKYVIVEAFTMGRNSTEGILFATTSPTNPDKHVKFYCDDPTKVVGTRIYLRIRCYKEKTNTRKKPTSKKKGE